MAKASRARARRARTPAGRTRKSPRRPRVPAHRTYTPELLANGRRRFEQTDESVASIATDFGIHHYSLIRLAKREGWVRHQRPPRGLPAAARLLAQAAELEAAHAAGVGGFCTAGPPTPDPPSLRFGGRVSKPAIASATAGDPSPPFAARMGGGEELAATPALQTDAQTAAPIADTIEQMHAVILAELATVKALRARMKSQPQKPADAQRTAQTLASLTATLRDLQRMQAAAPQSPQSGYDYDDMPADIDAFRNELARRIAAFMESRPDDGDAAEPPVPPVEPLRS